MRKGVLEEKGEEMNMFNRLLLFATLFIVSCSGWTYNGISGEDLRAGGVKEYAQMIGGGVLSAGVHLAGHALAYQAYGVSWHLDGLTEMAEERMSDSEAAMIGRAGPLLQLAVGYGMKWAGIDNAFTRGYNTVTLLEIGTYPAVDSFNGGGSDLDMIDRDSDAGAEWIVYTGLAAGLNYNRRKEQ